MLILVQVSATNGWKGVRMTVSPLVRLGTAALILMLAPASASLLALDDEQTTSPSPTITVVRKPGREDGLAQVTDKGKTHTITSQAVEAWPVREGQGALVLVNGKSSSTSKGYVLRYYDLDSGRRRILGTVPFRTAALKENLSSEEQWSFALTGKDPATGQVLTVVGDDEALPGLLPGAEAISFDGGSFVYSTPLNTDKQSIKTGDLIGTSLDGIYTSPQLSTSSFQYLQLFVNGTAMVTSNDGSIRQARWQTDGKTIGLTLEKTAISIPQLSLDPVKGVPAGTRFAVRLLQPLSSHTAKEGMIVPAVTITPIVIDGAVLIPAGSAIEGRVTKANSTGWGFRHETASLTVDWREVKLADGRTLPITARVYQVENAQEKVTPSGKIQGIRSTGTLGHSAESKVLTFAGIDPIAYIFASASGSAVLGFAEPEILYNAGTELVLENLRPLITAQTYAPSTSPMTTTGAERERLQDFVRTLTFRTRTQTSNKESDLTNLVFLGDPESLHRAFTAAGWLPADDLNSSSTFRTLKTLSGNQIYTQAPMSVLLLDKRPALFTLGKTTNTFSSRHHIRVFPTSEKWEGRTALTASSTQDIGIAFSRKQRSFIHVIDQHLDNERAKVINDLEFTGCVSSIDLVPRPWLPTSAYNATGDRLLTDRTVAVLSINACDVPKTTPAIVAALPNRLERITRDTSLTIRNDLYRGNLIYQGIAGSLAVRDYLRSSKELPEDYGAWRKTDASGANYNLVGSRSQLLHRSAARSRLDTSPEDLAAMAKIKESHKWDPPRYEFAIEGGNMFFRGVQSLSDVDILLTPPSGSTENEYELILSDLVNSGWSAGGTVTVNSWRYFSSEFSYFRQQGKYELDALTFTSDPNHPTQDDDVYLDAQRVGITTRQFEYNLLAQARPPTSRWRPYIAAGPVFQLIALADSPLKKPAGPFTLGLKNIGLIKAAFDFGNTPALDGGGVFQFGLQYGAGLKYRVTPHMIVRADYRETWSKNPDMIKNSYVGYESPDVDSTYTTDVLILKPLSKFFQDRFTLGVAFAF